MAILNIRNFDDESHQRLRMRAARNRRSMEAEARQILEDAMAAEIASAAAAATDLQQFVVDLAARRRHRRFPRRAPPRSPA